MNVDEDAKEGVASERSTSTCPSIRMPPNESASRRDSRPKFERSVSEFAPGSASTSRVQIYELGER